MTDTPPNYPRTLYTVLYSVILIIGAFGNLLVIVVIVKLKEMRNSTNILLANLAIADLLFLVIWGTEVIYGMNSKLNVTQLNKGICFAETVVWTTVAYTAVLSVLAIGFERYFAICQPLKAAYICTKSRAYKLCLLKWAFAFMFSSTRLMIVSYRPENYTNGTYFKPFCGESNEFQRKAYYITSSLVFSILPLIVLVMLYIKIAVHLKRAVASSVNIAAMRHHRRVLKMVAAVVLCFFLGQVPLRVRLLLVFAVGEQELAQWVGSERFENMTRVCFLVLYLHSAINPILYHVMSARFRAAFKSIVHDIVPGSTRWRRNWSSRGSTSNTTTATQMNTSSV